MPTAGFANEKAKSILFDHPPLKVGSEVFDEISYFFYLFTLKLFINPSTISHLHS